MSRRNCGSLLRLIRRRSMHATMGAMKNTSRVCPVLLSIAIFVLLPVGSRSASAQPSATTTASLPVSIAPPPALGKWGDFWIGRVKEFIAENAGLDPKQRNIVFLGDSLTQGFKLKSYFPDLPVLNRGIVSDGGCDFPFGRS